MSDVPKYTVLVLTHAAGLELMLKVHFQARYGCTICCITAIQGIHEITWWMDYMQTLSAQSNLKLWSKINCNWLLISATSTAPHPNLAFYRFHNLLLNLWRSWKKSSLLFGGSMTTQIYSYPFLFSMRSIYDEPVKQFNLAENNALTATLNKS